MDAPNPPGEDPGLKEQKISGDRRARMGLIRSAREVLVILLKVDLEKRSDDGCPIAKRGSNIPQG